MPRLWLAGEGRAFLDVRPEHRAQGYGLSVQLRVRAHRGCSGFVAHEEFFWADAEAYLDVIRGFLEDGELAIPKAAGISGLRFAIQRLDDARARISVTCRQGENTFDLCMGINMEEVWRFLMRLGTACEGMVRAAQREALRKMREACKGKLYKL